LNWFFNQWYFGSGHPKLSYTSYYEPVKKQVTVVINQSQDQPFEFPLAIDVYDNGKPKRFNVWVDAKAKNTFTFDSSKTPDLININADGILVADITDTKTPEQSFLQFTGSKEYKSKSIALSNIKEDAGKNPAAIKLFAAALKDPFFRIREQALEQIDLTIPEQTKALTADVEKLASNDPKTLVQAAAISALAKTKNAKYSSIYEKGLNAVSNAIKASSLAGIADLDPSKAAASIEKIDLDGASDDLMSKLLPIIVKNKIEKQMPAIGTTVAFYPFIKFQDPTLGKSAEEGYNWIMSSDNLKATEKVTKVLVQAKSQMPDNPQVKMMIVQMLKDGLNKKMEVLKNNPNSPTINQQIDAINKTIDAFK
jgi:aminopeptidase N